LARGRGEEPPDRARPALRNRGGSVPLRILALVFVGTVRARGGEPGRWAPRDEVLALCGAVREHEGTTLEYVTDGCLRGFRPDEVDLMADMTLAARRPLNWNVLTVDAKEPERYRSQLAANENAAAAGGRVLALTMPVLVEMNMSFLTYCALFMLPDWATVMNLPVAERMAKLRDPAVRRHLDERAHSPEAGVIGRLTSWGRYQIGDTFSAANDGLKGQRVGDVARARGQEPFDTLLDIVLNEAIRNGPALQEHVKRTKPQSYVGLAGGGLQPCSQGVLMDSFPQEKQGTAMTLFAVAESSQHSMR